MGIITGDSIGATIGLRSLLSTRQIPSALMHNTGASIVTNTNFRCSLF